LTSMHTNNDNSEWDSFLQRIPKGFGSKWENVSFPNTGDSLKRKVHDFLKKRLPEYEKNGGYDTHPDLTPFDRLVYDMLPEFKDFLDRLEDEKYERAQQKEKKRKIDNETMEAKNNLCPAINSISNSVEVSSVASSSTEFSSPSKMMKNSDVGDFKQLLQVFSESNQDTIEEKKLALAEKQLALEERKEKNREEEIHNHAQEIKNRAQEIQNRAQEIQNAKINLELQSKNNEMMFMVLSKFMENQPAPPK
jgi:hypothetical protein